MAHQLPAGLSVLSLEPLVLEEEFNTEEQEPDKHRRKEAAAVAAAGASDGAAVEPAAAAAGPLRAEDLLASPFDFLGLKTDPQLARFFEAIGQRGGQGTDATCCELALG
jgi:hypothetical protein